ncbi:MAG: 50S ribosomal protein L4 [Proteobacteria bacterium]|nr:50S ribosomal protein L4 [Pseudomonadota bacterium]
MPQVTLFDQQGASQGSIDLSESVFGAPLRRDLLHQAVVRHLANRRSGTADCKTRAEVSGGGRKPWRQKGTGRARHGSTRSPIWRKGGVVFGPHPRSYVQAMPRKMRRLALRSALSSKVTGNTLVALSGLSFEAYKTREFVKVLENLKVTDKLLLGESWAQQLKSTRRTTRVATHKALVVVAERDDLVFGSARNLPNVKVVTFEDLNVYDVLKYRRVIITKDAIARIEEVLS